MAASEASLLVLRLFGKPLHPAHERGDIPPLGHRLRSVVAMLAGVGVTGLSKNTVADIVKRNRITADDA